MTSAESDHIIKDLKIFFDSMSKYSEKAQLESFLSCYDDAPTFLAISSDGEMRNHEGFKKICAEYYNAVKEQQIVTIREKFQVIDTDLVVLGWTGNIIAQFKNGDVMKMTNYSVTYLFRKFDGIWKVIHAHESALPPEVIKK